MADDSSSDEDEWIMFSDTIVKRVRFDSIVVIHEVSRSYSSSMWITAQEIQANIKETLNEPQIGLSIVE